MEFEKVLHDVRNNVVSELILRNALLFKDQLRSLAEALKENTSVQLLDLCFNNIGGDGAFYLAEALNVNRSVTHLDLSRTFLGQEGTRRICDALKLNPCVKVLLLQTNEIGIDGGRAVGEMLKVNRGLTKLDVGWCGIEKDGLRAIGEALNGNHNLKFLDVDGNRMKGYESFFAECLARNGSLLECPGVCDAVDRVCNRNQREHDRIKLVVLTWLAIRRFRKSSLSSCPKEVVTIIARHIWKARTEVDDALKEQRVEDIKFGLAKALTTQLDLSGTIIALVPERNQRMHERVEASVVSFLCIWRARKRNAQMMAISKLIAMFMWETKTDIPEWNK